MHPLNALRDEDRRAHAVVETALQSQPLAKAPAGFAAGVLARIEKSRLSQAAARPAFRLHWLDLAICTLLSGMVGASFFVWQVLAAPQMAPFRAALRSQGLLFCRQVSFVVQIEFTALLLLLGVLIGLGLLLAGVRTGLLSAK
ncbi:MAG: hypothetical protein ACOYYS_21895 [Chloroflexota bacterium]